MSRANHTLLKDCCQKSKTFHNENCIVDTPITEPERSSIALRLVNQTDQNVNIVIMQRNSASEPNDQTIAWLVKSIYPHGISSFTFEFGTDIGYDGFHRVVHSESGQTFTAVPGNLLRLGNGAGVSLRNDKSTPVSANLFRNRLLVDRITDVQVGDTADFRLNPTFYLGNFSGIIQGQVLSNAEISLFNTQISILGIKSADINITFNSVFSFSLSNIVYS